MTQHLLNETAWMLATNPNASLRNGAEAVGYAERAEKLSGNQKGGDKPTILGTLAAAYAEAGRFPDAVRTGELAVQSVYRRRRPSRWPSDSALLLKITGTTSPIINRQVSESR